jgi:hypothetical protein
MDGGSAAGSRRALPENREETAEESRWVAHEIHPFEKHRNDTLLIIGQWYFHIRRNDPADALQSKAELLSSERRDGSRGEPGRRHGFTP